jgi:hypothetical protein
MYIAVALLLLASNANIMLAQIIDFRRAAQLTEGSDVCREETKVALASSGT